MKLDYLQFLELEIFTRFGARVEASMEAAIHRGQVLRELLKQRRLKPLSPRQQLAWLIAFNDGLFDKIAPERVPSTLDKLYAAVHTSSLNMDQERANWQQLVNNALTINRESKHE